MENWRYLKQSINKGIVKSLVEDMLIRILDNNEQVTIDLYILSCLEKE